MKFIFKRTGATYTINEDLMRDEKSHNKFIQLSSYFPTESMFCNNIEEYRSNE
jgi:hypothetical protein